VPLAVLALAILILVGWWAVTGAPVTPGIDFTGEPSYASNQVCLSKRSKKRSTRTVISVQGVVGSDNTYVVRLQSSDVQSIRQQAQAADMNILSSASTAPSFGAGGQQTAVIGLVVAFAGIDLLRVRALPHVRPQPRRRGVGVLPTSSSRLR